MPIKRKSQEFATRLENSRVELELSYSGLAHYLNSDYNSLKKWIAGEAYPRDFKLVDIGERLDWPEETIIDFMKNLPETGTLREIIIRILFLEMKEIDLINYLGTTRSIYTGWRDKGVFVPYDAAKKIVYLLSLSDQKLIDELKNGGVKPREELDIKLIQELEDEFGQMTNVPESHPKLKQLRKKVGS